MFYLFKKKGVRQKTRKEKYSKRRGECIGALGAHHLHCCLQAPKWTFSFNSWGGKALSQQLTCPFLTPNVRGSFSPHEMKFFQLQSLVMQPVEFFFFFFSKVRWKDLELHRLRYCLIKGGSRFLGSPPRFSIPLQNWELVRLKNWTLQTAWKRPEWCHAPGCRSRGSGCFLKWNNSPGPSC